ncbi:MAG: UDPGP type 1 family protein [Planctomycetaceae bacterium]|nr:UDPGP type 1 family protein [Planctomycetaceae bacterium]
MSPAPAILDLLKKHGEEHLLAHWEKLSEKERFSLESQLMTIDWHVVTACKNLVENQDNNKHIMKTRHFNSASTPTCHKLGRVDSASTEALHRGQEALAAGQVGAILVAGGQGTRLGFNGPKGTFPITTVSKASLFDVLLGRLHAVKKRFGRDVPLAIMTSSATDNLTRDFLTAANFCGLNSDQVFFFCQGNLPALDATTRKLFLDSCNRVAVAPDGHGGMLQALAESGGLEWFQRQGCGTLVSFQVDNPLAKPLDPEFIGKHILSDSSLSTQVVPKIDSEERVGVVAEFNGVTQIIEYSDLPENIATERLPNGRLRFFAGSIAIHAYNSQFLQDVASSSNALPLHLAHKKVPFCDETGQLIQPMKPNAFKFERFIFDLMPLADKITVVEIDSKEGFAPLKNPSGAPKDSPETVHESLNAYAIRHLKRVGIDVALGINVELDAASVFDDEDLRIIAQSGVFPNNHIDGPVVIRSI